MSREPSPAKIPTWVRWAAIVWLALWIPIYSHAWGFSNFLHFCDVAVILTCIGLACNSALLLSSQAVASLLVDAAWMVDVGWKLLFGHELLGGAEYLWDVHHPLWIRMLSLFHVAMPLVVLWAVYRLGYDRRGLPLQVGIALVGFIASRFTPRVLNINYAFADPFFHRAWGPAPTHIIVILLFMIVVVYVPTHLVLKQIFRPVRPQ